MIIVIHENKEWMPPFEEAFRALHLEHEFWYVPEMNLNLQDVPTEAVYYNRLSALVWTYDVNTNTNYSSAAEEQAKESAPLKIAEYLNSLQS